MKRHPELAEALLPSGQIGIISAQRDGWIDTPEVSIVHNDLRLPPGRFAPFWSIFSHLITNAADHGLETDDQRSAAGKALPGKVKLSTSLVRDELVVEISDDGRGIDWERVRSAAEARGLPHRSQKDLELALMSEGFSLKNSVSELSGRGVGLSAVHSVITALGGKIELESQHGKGSTWRFRLPAGKLEEPIAEPPVSSMTSRVSQSPKSAASH